LNYTIIAIIKVKLLYHYSFIEIELLYHCSVIVLNTSFISSTNATIYSLRTPRGLCQCKFSKVPPSLYNHHSAISQQLKSANIKWVLLNEYHQMSIIKWILLNEYYQMSIIKSQEITRSLIKCQRISKSIKKCLGLKKCQRVSMSRNIIKCQAV